MKRVGCRQVVKFSGDFKRVMGRVGEDRCVEASWIPAALTKVHTIADIYQCETDAAAPSE
jgi:hypothetical protein